MNTLRILVARTPMVVTAALCLLPFAAAAALVSVWPMFRDYDIFLHLKSGQWMAEHRSILRQDLFSYLTTGSPTEAHSWMGDLCFWLFYRVAGYAGLRFLAGVLMVGALAAVFVFLRRRTGDLAAATLGAAIAVVLIQTVFIFRPVVFEFFFFNFYSLFLLAELRPMTGRQWVMAGLVLLLWSNLHGSSVLGVILFGSYGVALLCKLLIHDGKALSQIEANEWLAIFSAVLAFAVTILNPIGYKLYTYSWQLSRIAKTVGVAEWGSANPFVWRTDDGLSPVLAVIIHPKALSVLFCGILLLFALRWGRYRPGLRFYAMIRGFCFIAMAVQSRRHIPLLVCPISESLAALWPYSYARPISSWRKGAHLVACAMLSLWLFSSVSLLHCRGVPPLIRRSVDFLEEAGVQGRVFNFWPWGDYLSYRLYPRIQIAVNGSHWLHRKYFKLQARQWQLYGQNFFPELIAETGGTDLVMFRRRATSPEFRDLNQWIPIFENDVSFIALHRDSRNRENLERVTAYYRKMGVPFDAEHGFELSRAYQTSPAWVWRHQEEVDPAR